MSQNEPLLHQTASLGYLAQQENVEPEPSEAIIADTALHFTHKRIKDQGRLLSAHCHTPKSSRVTQDVTQDVCLGSQISHGICFTVTFAFGKSKTYPEGKNLDWLL